MNLIRLFTRLIFAIRMLIHQRRCKKEAYQIGTSGQRFRGFSTIGVDSDNEDIRRSIHVYVIDRYNEAPAALLKLAVFMLAPVLHEYIHGLRAGGHNLQDLSAPIKRLRAAYQNKV